MKRGLRLAALAGIAALLGFASPAAAFGELGNHTETTQCQFVILTCTVIVSHSIKLGGFFFVDGTCGADGCLIFHDCSIRVTGLPPVSSHLECDFGPTEECSSALGFPCEDSSHGSKSLRRDDCSLFGVRGRGSGAGIGSPTADHTWLVCVVFSPPGSLGPLKPEVQDLG